MLARAARLGAARGGSALARSSALSQVGAVRRLAAPPSLPTAGAKFVDPMVPDLVLEEEDTGMPAGLPHIPEKDIWANPDQLVRPNPPAAPRPRLAPLLVCAPLPRPPQDDPLSLVPF